MLYRGGRIACEPGDNDSDTDSEAGQTVYLAFIENRAAPAGQITLSPNWNNYALIEDLSVDVSCRRSGIGRKLIDQAITWARAAGMKGIMLETQNNNVKACLFYESCGFRIGGMDACLYKGLDLRHRETALFWYLLFD